MTDDELALFGFGTTGQVGGGGYGGRRPALARQLVWPDGRTAGSLGEKQFDQTVAATRLACCMSNGRRVLNLTCRRRFAASFIDVAAAAAQACDRRRRAHCHPAGYLRQDPGLCTRSSSTPARPLLRPSALATPTSLSHAGPPTCCPTLGVDESTYFVDAHPRRKDRRPCPASTPAAAGPAISAPSAHGAPTPVASSGCSEPG